MGIFGNFNSQPHKEADKGVILLTYEEMHFNSQPHKEADRKHPQVLTSSIHFNSQPHKEADVTSAILIEM